MDPLACRHCEERPAATPWGLCGRCDRKRGIRLLYLPRRGQLPVDEIILQRLRQRANARLPLFPPEGA
jgi:hypothetical protein